MIKQKNGVGNEALVSQKQTNKRTNVYDYRILYSSWKQFRLEILSLSPLLFIIILLISKINRMLILFLLISASIVLFDYLIIVL